MLGKRIQEIRKFKKLSVDEMAVIFDMKSRTLGSYERGESNPNPEFITRLTEVWNINLNWLYTGKGPMFLDELIPTGTNQNYLFEIQKKHKFTTAEMVSITDFFEGGKITREVFFVFMKAKKGDKEALDTIFKTLQGLKLAYE